MTRFKCYHIVYRPYLLNISSERYIETQSDYTHLRHQTINYDHMKYLAKQVCYMFYIVNNICISRTISIYIESTS